MQSQRSHDGRGVSISRESFKKSKRRSLPPGQEVDMEPKRVSVIRAGPVDSLILFVALLYCH